MDIYDLTQTVIGCAHKVHNQLGAGFLEKVYETALCLELHSAGLAARQQVPLNVYYNDCIVGEYFVDLLVEERLIIELKAVQNLAKEHEVQLVHYLAATEIEDGLLINFGASVQVKRKYRTYRPSRPKPLTT